MELSLDCLTLIDKAPDALIETAAEAGFDLGSFLLQPPAAYPRQLLHKSL
jgi:hypothetical protein